MVLPAPPLPCKPQKTQFIHSMVTVSVSERVCPGVVAVSRRVFGIDRNRESATAEGVVLDGSFWCPLLGEAK